MRLDSEIVHGLAKAAQTMYEWSKEVTRPATPLMMSSKVSPETLCYKKRSHHTEIHRLHNYNFDPTRHLNNLNQSCAQWCAEWQRIVKHGYKIRQLAFSVLHTWCEHRRAYIEVEKAS